MAAVATPACGSGETCVPEGPMSPGPPHPPRAKGLCAEGGDEVLAGEAFLCPDLSRVYLWLNVCP